MGDAAERGMICGRTGRLNQSTSFGHNLPGEAKTNPLKLFTVFSATSWNFSVKFYVFMWLPYLHLTGI